MIDDTIAAIATPLGEGGLAVIRISGSRSLAAADRIFAAARKGLKPSGMASHTVAYGRVMDYDLVVDEVLLTVMRAPRTFTREDVVEISCHGGVLATKTVLDIILKAGVRLAEPGEFTRRAFLNGRIDLAQAEAVADLIHSQTEIALRAANEQLAGKLSVRINQVRDDLVKTLAHVEAHIDFPDEDIAPDTREALLKKVRAAEDFVAGLLKYSNEGQVLRRGIRTAIIGRPNVGKSSLLNQLLGHDRAIVSPVPGTTRDTIQETANIRGVPVIFIDTAGLRSTEDTIEIEGIKRTRLAIERADLVLHVFDCSAPMSELDREQLGESRRTRRILVLNKCDLPHRLELASSPEERVVKLSCATGAGVEELKDQIKDTFWKGEAGAGMLEVMINSRHQNALQRSEEALDRCVQAFEQNEALDHLALDLRIATNAIGEIVGRTTTEDILDSIFSQFCLGK